MAIGEVSRTTKARVEINVGFLTVTANKFPGKYIIVGIRSGNECAETGLIRGPVLFSAGNTAAKIRY